MRSFSELAAIDVAKEVFFDENGVPNENYWRFVNDCSIFNYPQPDVNGANADVMAAVGQYTDTQQQAHRRLPRRHGPVLPAGPAVASRTPRGSPPSRASAGTPHPSAPRSRRSGSMITVHDGRSQYRLSTVVSPQGGATINQTNAVNPNRHGELKRCRGDPGHEHRPALLDGDKRERPPTQPRKA